MGIQHEATRQIETADPETVERWIRERTKYPASEPMGEVLVGEAAERAIVAEQVPAVQEFQHRLEAESPPADWMERAEEALGEKAHEALCYAGTLTDMAAMARDRLIGVVRMPDGDLRPFRTIDVATGLDSAAMLRENGGTP